MFEGADGARIFVDPRSLKLLDGTVLDFDEENLLATSFTLREPAREEHVRLRGELFGVVASQFQLSVQQFKGLQIARTNDHWAFELVTCNLKLTAKES